MAVTLLVILFTILRLAGCGQLRLKPGNSSSSSTEADTQIKVLEEALQGPLSGGSGLVLYWDPVLEMRVLQDILMTIPELRETPKIMVNLDNDGGLWCEEQSDEVLHGHNLLHIVVFEEDPRPFFQSVSLEWNPKYLLLFNVATKVSFSILMDEIFNDIQYLAMFRGLQSTHVTSPSKMGIYTVFPFARTRQLAFLGSWNSTTHSSLSDVFPDRFPTFEGHEFHLGTWLIDPPFIYQKPGAPIGTGTGVSVYMLDAMALTLNYSYTLTAETPDCMWGTIVNGSWNGMLGMIDRGEKNFTVNLVTLVSDRARHFEASVPIIMYGYAFALPIPEPLPKWWSLFYSFKFNVWISFAITLVAVIITLIFMRREPLLASLSNTWHYLLRAMVNQSVPQQPVVLWQRVFLGSWWIYSMIFCVAYTANLISFLSIPAPSKRIHTIEELAESKYRVSMLDYGEFVPESLRRSLLPEYRALYRKLDLSPHAGDMLNRLSQKTHALLDVESFMLYQFPKLANNTYLMSEKVFISSQCWYYQKNAAWRIKFDTNIQLLHEAGLTSHWLKTETDDLLFEERRHLQEMEDKETGRKDLGVEHLQAVFFFLLIGWVLGMVVFVGEMMCNLKKN